jgi:adenylate cyclase class 2
LLWGDLVLCIDEMPFGVFLELEGPGDTIQRMAGDLGLEWARRILLNYYDLFDIIRRDLNLDFSDITFTRFAGIQVDMERYRPQIEAGDAS